MKIVMTLLVRDEQDIIRDNIEFHRAQGVDHFIATDNRSVDRTAEILTEYEAQGILTYLWEGDDDYSQSAWVTRMARMAATEFNADWVINNDADEFWMPASGTLRSTFERLPPAINALVAARHNFASLTDPGPSFLQSMVYRHVSSLNPLGHPLPPKMAHRAHPDVVVGQGNHRVDNVGRLRPTRDGVEILHFPVRTPRQLINKIRNGGAAYQRNAELPDGLGITWRHLYRQLDEHGNLDEYLAKEIFGPGQIASGLAAGELVEDRRLANFMRALEGHAH